METPSRAPASSPDPLNSGEGTVARSAIISSAARRITRSQRSSSMYSLDNKSNAKHSPYSYNSPRKQTFHLDVGSGISPHKIRVTVETEDGQEELEGTGMGAYNDAEVKVNRRLFPAPDSATPKAASTASTARRRQRSSSPTKRVTKSSTRKTATTTTTKVPLRGLSDDETTPEAGEVATPKPRRGRPRRSGTPLPTASKKPLASASPGTPGSASFRVTKRGRKPRAATPKAENDSSFDELASMDATPALISPVKHTSIAATPKSASAPRTTTRNTPKLAASAAFPHSDADSIADSITDSRPRKRGRGRPRRQAMAPDEMAVIVEREELGLNAPVAAASATPDPIGLSSRPTPSPARSLSPIETTRVAISPAPTSLSSVDMINVQTPARQSQDNPADDRTEDDYVPEYFAHEAPYVEDEAGANEDIDSTPIGNAAILPNRDDASVDYTATPTPFDARVDDDQTPRASIEIGETNTEENEHVEDDDYMAISAPFNEQDVSADELATVMNSEVVNTFDAPIDNEGALTGNTYDNHGDAAKASIDNDDGEVLDEPSNETTGAGDALAIADYEEHALPMFSPKRDLPSHGPSPHRRSSSRFRSDDQIHFSNIATPSVHGTPDSRGHHEEPTTQSELTGDDSDGEIDVVALDAAVEGGRESDAEFDQTESAIANLRDQDTIAQGENFTMIGMESLQTSINMPHSDLPEMGETTSRIVSRTLESLRQGKQNDSQQNDGLSMLDFLYQSSPGRRSHVSNSPQGHSAKDSSPVQAHDSMQRSSPRPKSVSPKKAEPLGKVIARKSLQEAQSTTASPHTASRAEDIAKAQSPRQDAENYDDSFSDIPEYVLQAAVPQATETAYFSQMQADLTGRVNMSQSATDGRERGRTTEESASSQPDDVDYGGPTHVAGSPILGRRLSAERHMHSAIAPANNEEEDDSGSDESDDELAANQPEAEVTSSPPVHMARRQHPVLEQPTAQRHRFAQENRTTPLAFLSPRFPPAAPHEGSSEQKNRLHPPTEGFRPSLSPIVRAGRALQSVTSDPPTPKDSEGFLRSPFRSSVARDTQSPAAIPPRDSSSPDPQRSEFRPVDVQPADSEPAEVGEVVDDDPAGSELANAESIAGSDTADVDRADAEPADAERGESEPVETETAETEQMPVATPSQQQPPSASRPVWNMAFAPFTGIKNLVVSGAQIVSPRLRTSASASPAPQAPHTPVRAAQSQGAVIATVSPPKRSAVEASLDEPESDQPSSRAKRPRVDSSATKSVQSSPPHHGRTEAGSGTGRSWRSYIFRENTVAAPIPNLTTKAPLRLPDNAKNSDDRARPSALASEANSTEYGSDAILNMINDISGEGNDVEAPERSILEPDSANANDIPQMTPAVVSSNEPQEVDDEHVDDEVDIWAVEAERSTRAPTRAAAGLSSSPANLPSIVEAPIRDPRISRLAATDLRRSLRRRSPQTSRQDARLRDEESREYSLLDKESEVQDSIQDRNPPGQPSRFNLDDFFSSPIAVPRQLSPTSEHNIKFNEKSRRQAMEQLLEHEREREARKNGTASIQTRQSNNATARAASSSLLKPLSVATAESEVSEHSVTGSAGAISSPAQDAPAPLHEAPVNASYYGKPSAAALSSPPMTEEVQKPKAQPKTLSARAESVSDENTDPSDLENNEALESLPTRPDVGRGRFGNSQLSQADVSRPTEIGISPTEGRNSEDAIIIAPSQANLDDTAKTTAGYRQQANRRPLAFAFGRQSLSQPGPMRTTSLFRRSHDQTEAADKSPVASARATGYQSNPKLSPFAPGMSTSRNIFFEEAPELQPQPSRSFGQRRIGEEEGSAEEEQEVDDIDEEDELSRVEQDESSFLTPILKPLPDKSASPTKSSFRPPTKPKTPGRVVEFTSSTNTAGVADEIVAEHESMQDATLRFAEHFALDTDNRMPSIAGFNRTGGPGSNADAYNLDGDVFMLNAKDTSGMTQNAAAANRFQMGGDHHSNDDRSGRSSNRSYEVDQELSDMMLSDANQISLPHQQHAYTPGTPAQPAGRADFQPATTTVRDSWQAPAAMSPERPPRHTWTLDDWVALNEMLQTYRAEGPLNFKLRHLPPAKAPTKDAQRPSQLLLNKVVHARNEAMLVKAWHLDIVDAFARKAGRAWNEHYLVRRLFSLLIGETRRGVFASPSRREA